MKMLCNHGANAYCTNCMPYVPDKAKHQSFENYMNERKKNCKHAEGLKCPNCTLPPLPKYCVNYNCSKHPPFPRGLCTSCSPQPATLNRQMYRYVDHVQIVDSQCLQVFINEWIEFGEDKHRFALVYGKYHTQTGEYGTLQVATVYGLYTPKQHFDGRFIIPEADPMLRNVDGIFNALKCQCIGLAMTHSPHELPLTSYDIQLIAPLQLRYKDARKRSSEFITIAIGRDQNKSIVPEALMLSDQCLCMFRDGVIAPPNDPTKCRSKSRGPRNEPLSVVIRNDKEKGPQEVSEFEPDFFLVQLTIGVPSSNTISPLFKRYYFPSPNSAVETKVSLLQELKATFCSTDFEDRALKDALSDLNLQLVLADVIGIEVVLEISQFLKSDIPIPYDLIDLLRVIAQSDM